MSDMSGEFEVGYGKPPKASRFKKGVSGNPKGRPKRAANKRKIDTSFGCSAAKEFLKLEAYRPVAIREGDRVIELPAIQAVFRAMGVSAMKGNRFAQRTLAELVGNMEASHHRLKMEYFGTAIDYKKHWEEEIDRCRQLGLAAPQPLPHPADIVLDPNTGDVRILGPQTVEQKQAYDIQLARRDDAQSEVSEFAAKFRSARDPVRKAQWLDWWHHEQLIFDTINDLVGPRYRVELKDRSWKPGASAKATSQRSTGLLAKSKWLRVRRG